MKYPNYCWVDVAYNGAQHRNNLVKITEVRPPSGAADCFRTVFRYPDAMREHFAKHRTVSGYDGYVYADWMPLDFDADDLETALEVARTALNQLAARYDVELGELWCFFSGAKGFHILVPAEMLGLEPSKEMPSAFRRLAGGLFDGVKLDTSIYDKQRLFRLANTRHGTSGLYKVPLSAREILTLSAEEILELAKEPRQLDVVQEVRLSPVLSEMYAKALAEVRAKPEPKTGKRQSRVKACIASILGGVGKGERNTAGLRLAVHYAKAGLGYDMLVAVLKAWNTKNEPPLSAKEVEQLAAQGVEKPYDFGCNDSVLQQYCRSDCYIRERQEKPKPDTSGIKDIGEAYEAYLEYVASLKKGRIQLGIPEIDRRMRGIAPGEVCQVIARGGVGKTALLLNVLKSVGEQGVKPVLFFTMEMPLAQVFERIAQLVMLWEGKRIEQEAQKAAESLQQADPQFAGGVRRIFEVFEHVYFVEQDGLALGEVQQFIRKAEARIGQKPRLVAIDYMGRMDGGPGTTYEATSRLAKGLKQLAKNERVAVISLHQVSRAGGDGSEPIRLDMGRDSGVIEEAADFIIGLWRPDKKDKIGEPYEDIVVALLKNRRGYEVQTKLLFDKPRLRIYESKESEEEEYVR